MKQYVTEAEYRALGGAMPPQITGAALQRLLGLATLKVDEMTLHRLRAQKPLTPYQNELVQRATVAQADALYALESAEGLEGANVAGFSVTDVSVSYGTPSAAEAAARERQYSKVALACLEGTGLLWRGV